MMQTPLKGVVIGAGYFSQYHFEAWSRIPQVRIVANCNRTEAQAIQRQRQFSIPRCYTDWRKMLEAERPDFVDIITPPETHLEMCRYAAERGIAIVCQKPLAPTLQECRQVVELTRRHNVRFMVHENWRWQPWWRQIKLIQERQTIGEFTYLLFRMRTGDGWGENAYLDRQPFFRDYPRLLVYETGVHFIDTFRFLFGEVQSVFAHLRRLNPVIKGEETGQVFFRFASGQTAIWDAGRYNEPDEVPDVESDADTSSAAPGRRWRMPNPRYTFGDLRIDAMGGHLTMDTTSEIRIKPLGEPGYVWPYERADVNFAGDCVYAVQRHFVECLLTGREFESHGEDYLKTLQVVEAVYESAKQGQVVRLGH